MARICDFQFALLLEEIGYSMRDQTPIRDAMQRLENRRLGSVAVAAREIRENLDCGTTTSQAVSRIGSLFSDQASAAVEACEECGDPGLLLRMASQLRRRAEETRSVRLAWFYPYLLLLVGYAVGVLSFAPIVLNSQGRGFQWPVWVYQLAQWVTANWWIPPLVVFVLIVSFLFWRRSLIQLPRSTRYSLFCRTLSDQVRHGIAEDDAIRCAVMMSGDSELIAILNPSMESPEIACLLASVDHREPAVAMSTGGDVLVAKLQCLASKYELSSRRRTYLVTRLIPRVAVFLIGGGFTVLYALWIIAPAYLQVSQW